MTKITSEDNDRLRLQELEALDEKCHAPLPRIGWIGDATRVGDAYT